MKVEKGVSVALQYRLTYDNAEGEFIEETTKEDPLVFTVGAEEMLDMFEKNILGLGVSDEFGFTLEPKEGYGPIQEELVVEYSKETFMVDEDLDEDFLQEGELVEMKDEEGNVFEGIIEENKLNSVVVNFNHPLAGEALHFKGYITRIS
ncbi:MAG: peptidylprolyl isomerase [Flavobacteriales bacterium]